MTTFISMVVAFLVGFSVGVQRTRKKQRKEEEAMAELKKQEQIRQIHQKLRGNGPNEKASNDVFSDRPNETNTAGISTDNPYLDDLYEEESEI